MNDWQPIIDSLSEATGSAIRRFSLRPLAGGCINAAHALTDDDTGTTWFVKINDASRAEMFSAEAEALSEIAATGTIRVPHPVCHGVASPGAWLALEFVDLSGARTPSSETALGAQLAAMHRIESPDGRFGWHRHGTIGSTPQPNDWEEDWGTFFAEQRLGFQFELAAQGGHRFRDADTLLERLPEIFKSHRPRPSLLHGDLWGGNAACDSSGNPVLFDPATYYGDRETDLAFTEMFGGFGPPFYESYRASWPMDEGASQRVALYNLYHVLNHHNLFGGGYGNQAQGVIDQLLQR